MEVLVFVFFVYFVVPKTYLVVSTQGERHVDNRDD